MDKIRILSNILQYERNGAKVNENYENVQITINNSPTYNPSAEKQSKSTIYRYFQNDLPSILYRHKTKTNLQHIVKNK